MFLAFYAAHVATNVSVSKECAVTLSIAVCTSPFSRSWLIVDRKQLLITLKSGISLCYLYYHK
jgi:hypothetical protein